MINDIFKSKSKENIEDELYNMSQYFILKKAIEIGYTLKVKELIGNPNINIYNFNDLFRLSIMHNHIKIVKFLLNKGADVHANNDFAIRHAAHNGHVEVVKLLLDRGANVHAYNNSALRIAAKNGHTKIVKLLLDAGANIKVIDFNIVKHLVKKGYNDIIQICYEEIKLLLNNK